MPRRQDLKKILLIGSGPIVIGQACEFDYSGNQGAKSLRDEGYEVVLVNSNPATIMTDPAMADRTYVEPLDVPTLRAIIERDKPDAVLPTLGGQTALNLALELHERGILKENGVELIGARPEAIVKAENRKVFKALMKEIGLEVPRSGFAHTVEEARAVVEGERGTGYPCIVRASYALGGTGAGIANAPDELEAVVSWALSQSPKKRVLVEESLLGWKEFELEVMRDRADNFIVVCSIENIDPMGVHTGDSVTVAPAMTLTDREYQRLRDAARAVITEVGVETGGANVQFATDPETGRMVVIEMNPRVSRSSALASKATGYPIAKISAKLAVGYTLDELENDITGTSAAFEPTIDYVVVKWPRFSFEKFPGVDTTLGTQMKSVGEAMSIGRTFCEALEKAARSLETGHDGMSTLRGRFDYHALRRSKNAARDMLMEAPAEPRAPHDAPPPSDPDLRTLLRQLVQRPQGDRLFFVTDALRLGVSVDELFELTKIDRWFLHQLDRIVQMEKRITNHAVDAESALDADVLREAKRMGMSDARIARLAGLDAAAVAKRRSELGLRPTFSNVDTCAAEMPARTPYMYATYTGDGGAEIPVSNRKKVVILGGGPNRIGQGIEFDYCCVHASFALREMDIETIMVNCNPETVSTDYDTSDRLYFEPLCFEDVLAICHEEQSQGELLGVIVQFGGQTPLKLAVPLAKHGINLLGTPADAIDRAEDRERFDEVLNKLDMQRPPGGIAREPEEAKRVAEELGYPVLVRPSYVLGGRAMMVCDSASELEAYMHQAVEVAKESGSSSILVDKFINDAIEVDVDAVGDGQRVVIGGVMQHIEEAGVHSGDSACVLPPHSLSSALVASIEERTRLLGVELGVIGLMNVQYAVKGNDVYVLEVNPRAARTVPFVSKATGRPLAKIAAKVMAGQSLDDQGVEDLAWPALVAVKESVFPFIKLPGVDTQLGPEMRSTGEVMGVARTFARAYGKALTAAGVRLPKSGRAFISVQHTDKAAATVVARRLRALGFEIVATQGTADYLERARIPAERIKKVAEGSPHIVDAMREGTIDLVVNTTRGARAISDSYSIRRQALQADIPYFTTLSAALAGVGFMEAKEDAGDAPARVRSLQEWT